MERFAIFDYSFKIGVLLVAIAFITGFFGNKYYGVSYAMAYYTYLYTLVIVFAGIQYGMVGGFFTSTMICILHVVGLNANPLYYSANSAVVGHNVQVVYFTLLGVISGYSYEFMARQCNSLAKSLREANLRLQNAVAQPQAAQGAEMPSMPSVRMDTSVKFYNFLLKFSRSIVACKSQDDVFEALFKALAVDYGAKECALFMVTDKGRELTGKMKKGLQHIENIEETKVGFGEGLIGKSAANSQVMINDVSEKTNEWQIALPVTLNGSAYAVIGIARCRTIGMITPEDVQYLGRVAEISSACLSAIAGR